MAHEIAHVALRHGTAQATKAQKFQIGAIAGQILGAIVGGTAGSVIAQGSNFGLGAYFLKYGREYEREADLLGAQIMARAGYDPRRMADMFRTIEQQSGGSGGPEWLSSHPNPGNRYDAIQREAAMLRIEGSRPSEAEFTSVKSRLNGMPPAYTAEQIARAKPQRRTTAETAAATIATTIRPRQAGAWHRRRTANSRCASATCSRMRVPSNWRQTSDNDSVTFGPDGAFYRGDSGTGFTHGVQLGVIPSESHDLQQATDELIDSLQRGNPQLRPTRNAVRDVIGGRNALTVDMRNVSDATGRPERVSLSTVGLRDGSLLYVIAVAPQEEGNVYANAFRRMKESIQLTDRETAYRR